jgi:hypothetical protein
LAAAAIAPRYGHGLVHRPDVVGADLVTEPARPGVDHHADLAVTQPEGLRSRLVVDLGHRLHLEKVVARAQAADLAQASGHRAVTDLRGVGTVDGATVFTSGEISRYAVALLHGVPGATEQHPLQLRPPGKRPHPTVPGAPRDGPVQPVHHLLDG